MNVPFVTDNIKKNNNVLTFHVHFVNAVCAINLNKTTCAASQRQGRAVTHGFILFDIFWKNGLIV